MKWSKNHLKLNQTDLAILNLPQFAEEKAALLSKVSSADHTRHPLYSPAMLTMLVHPECESTAVFFRSYWEMLSCSNHAEKHYRCFTLPPQRQIHAPAPEIRAYQKWIYKNLLAEMPLSEATIAYRRGCKLSESLRCHEGARWMLKMDISSFFNSIRENQVYRVFEQLGYYSRAVTVLLTKLTTLNGHLPQGAPSSPALANLVMLDFDNTILQYCTGCNLRYTRYSDDLVFSGDDMDAPALIRFVTRELAKLGLQVNREKTRVYGPGSRHYALGVVCNEFAHTPRTYRRELRKEFHFIQKYGLAAHLDRKFNAKNRPQPGMYIRRLLGKTSWILSFEPENKEFLGYKHFLEKELWLYTEVKEYGWFECSDDYYRVDEFTPQELREMLLENGVSLQETDEEANEEYVQESFW